MAILGSLIALAGIGPTRAFWDDAALSTLSADAADGHLLISEILTGAASASDEFVEIFNPTAGALPLEGLEVVYVTASGATVTRKAAWPAGAPGVPPGGHTLLANEAGIYAAVADATYAGGLAATGGSVALRIQGAGGAIDALGWGTAASAWVETAPAAAPPAGSSLERLPGGSAGSWQDTDRNAVDLVIRDVPDPQNSGSPPTPSSTATPTATPQPTTTATPTSTATTSPTPTATPTASSTSNPTPTPAPVISIADARMLPDGATVTLSGVTLSDSAFTEGGGYLLDATGGIAVLLSDGTFSRGREVRVTGALDTRYQQRTVRASPADVADVSDGAEPGPLAVTTGAVGEAFEAILVKLQGEVVSAATTLSSGIAFDVDDGSGPVRVLVGSATGIDTATWERGTTLSVVGVVGQRDATATGTSGYRVQPRDASDIGVTTPTPSPTPTPIPTLTPTPIPTPTPTSTPTPTPSDGLPPLISIAQARAAATGTELRVRGVVTLGSGLVDPTSAIVQDASAGILVRLGDDLGVLHRGELVELTGKRSTKSGMLTLRVTAPPRRLGTQADPTVVRKATGQLGEVLEAQLVVVRGALTANPRRSSAGNVTFGVDDGSGEIRVVIAAETQIDAGGLVAGAWIETRGVLGQETTGAQPLRGYRIWPRDASDLQTLAAPVAATPGGPTEGSGTGDNRGGASGAIEPRNVRLQPVSGVGRAPAGRTPTGERSPSGKSPAFASGPRASASESAAGLSAPAATVAHDESRNPLVPLGILALALLSLTGLGFVAWQGGTFDRLMAVLHPEHASSVPADFEAPAETVETLPRLSVIRPPQDSRSP